MRGRFGHNDLDAGGDGEVADRRNPRQKALPREAAEPGFNSPGSRSGFDAAPPSLQPPLEPRYPNRMHRRVLWVIVVLGVAAAVGVVLWARSLGLQ